MLLCFKCSLKKECREICEDVEQYLKFKRNYKTTYVNKEIGISDIAIKEKAMMDYQAKERSSGKGQIGINHKTWMLIQKIINDQLTDKQKAAVRYFLEGRSMEEIGKKMNVIKQTVHSTLFGHPVHGGGAVRKIQKIIKSHRDNGKLTNDN